MLGGKKDRSNRCWRRRSSRRRAEGRKNEEEAITTTTRGQKPVLCNNTVVVFLQTIFPDEWLRGDDHRMIDSWTLGHLYCSLSVLFDLDFPSRSICHLAFLYHNRHRRRVTPGAQLIMSHGTLKAAL